MCGVFHNICRNVAVTTGAGCNLGCCLLYRVMTLMNAMAVCTGQLSRLMGTAHPTRASMIFMTVKTLAVYEIRTGIGVHIVSPLESDLVQYSRQTVPGQFAGHVA